MKPQIPDSNAGIWKYSIEARHYRKLDGDVLCQLCPHMCNLAEGKRGKCRVRINKGGRLYSLVYGNPCAIHVDPVEKKPLFHFLPGSEIFSFGTAGCNLRCLGCQNYEISQSFPEDTDNYSLTPEKAVEAAIQAGCPSIAYTYTEPIIFYEYAYDTAKIAKSKGIKNVMVTAGYINEKPLREMCKVVDAANVDLKNFKEEIYQKLNGVHLAQILNTLKVMKEEGVWVEITNLVIPKWTDDLKMIGGMCRWLHENGFDDTPLHFSRFQPLYKLSDLYPTPVETLESARKIAIKEGLKYVYVGNVPGTEYENTYCPKCGKPVVKRDIFTVTENNMKGGCCKFCGEKIAGIWQAKK